MGEHNPDATLDLDAQGVVSDARRFYLVTPSTGQLLEPSVMNAVELTSAPHSLVRFVCELHRSHSAVLIPFPRGAASRLPFLPEIRVGRTILSPACWRLARRNLGDGPDWRRNLTDWRLHYDLPYCSGVPLSLGISGANMHDSLGLEPLCPGSRTSAHVEVRAAAPAVKLHTDKGYDYRHLRRRLTVCAGGRSRRTAELLLGVLGAPDASPSPARVSCVRRSRRERQCGAGRSG